MYVCTIKTQPTNQPPNPFKLPVLNHTHSYSHAHETLPPFPFPSFPFFFRHPSVLFQRKTKNKVYIFRPDREESRSDGSGLVLLTNGLCSGWEQAGVLLRNKD